MPNRIANKKIIVTGASSGIGERIAWHIAKNGGIPIMLARSIDQLNKNQQLLKKVFYIESFVYQVDLQNEKSINNMMGQMLAEHDQIHGLVNNAGMGVFDYVTNMEREAIESMFQLNTYALIWMTKILLPHFSKYQEGHIVNIASQAGKLATPKSAVYAATKHAVLGFSNALRLEVKQAGINVLTVNLGPVRTRFFERADPEGTYQKNIEKYMLDPDQVAQKIVKSLFTKKREINLPWWMEFGSKLYYIAPGIFEYLLRKQFNKK